MYKLKVCGPEGLNQINKHKQQNNSTTQSQLQIQNQIKLKQKNKHIHKILSQLTQDEKYQWINLKKLKAQQQYNNKQYQKAIEIYSQSLLGIESQDINENNMQLIKNQLQIPIMLNIIDCYQKLKQLKNALALCNKLFQLNLQYLPTIYKKICLEKQVQDYILAKQFINLGIKLAKQNQKLDLLFKFIQLNSQVIKAAKSDDYENRNVYMKIYGKLNQEEYQEQHNRLLRKNKEQQQQQYILYYQEDPTNICAKIYRKIKKPFLCMFSFVKLSKKKSKKSIKSKNSKNF